MKQNNYENYIKILNKELVPALGCTEPIAVAYAGSLAKDHINNVPLERMIIKCSSNIIKNVKNVTIPNTGGLKGVEASAIAGFIAGRSSHLLEVIAEISDESLNKIKHLLENGICTVELLDSTVPLHIIIEAYGLNTKVVVEIVERHTNVASIKYNDVEMISNSSTDQIDSEVIDYSSLNFADIIDFVENYQIEDLYDLLNQQVIDNLAISEKGLSGAYGINIGKLLLNNTSCITLGKVLAYTAAASEARMAGCALPVITNSGSGNQGIVVSVPIIIYCADNKFSIEKTHRALALSNLLNIYQKSKIGSLSAFCGIVNASAAVAAALTYLENGNHTQIANAFENVLLDLSGLICDGAKTTCGLKVCSGINAAFLSKKIALSDKAYGRNIGVVCSTIDDTIEAIGVLGKYGMEKTDKVILDILHEKIDKYL